LNKNPKMKDPFQLEFPPKLNLIKKRLKLKRNIDMKQERGCFNSCLLGKERWGCSSTLYVAGSG